MTWCSWIARPRDHLRVCGADPSSLPAVTPKGGSSPRVRSRLGDEVEAGRLRGIISACAEQTVIEHRRLLRSGDHLRVCGADVFRLPSHVLPEGSSPRVRSRPERSDIIEISIGIISACAEQTLLRGLVHMSTRDHLRVCGADFEKLLHIVLGEGSSPRVRSRR